MPPMKSQTTRIHSWSYVPLVTFLIYSKKNSRLTFFRTRGYEVATWARFYWPIPAVKLLFAVYIRLRRLWAAAALAPRTSTVITACRGGGSCCWLSLDASFSCCSSSYSSSSSGGSGQCHTHPSLHQSQYSTAFHFVVLVPVDWTSHLHIYL